MNNRCSLCGQSVLRCELDQNRVYHVNCSTCKPYQISDAAMTILDKSRPHPRLSGVVRFRFENTGQEALITTDNIQNLESASPDERDVPAKIRYLLRSLAQQSKHPGEAIRLHGDRDYPICFSANADEFHYYLWYLKQAGYADVTNSDKGAEVVLTPHGWEESNRIPTLQSETAFVAMSFSRHGKYADLLKRAYEDGIRPALEADTGYHAVRLDYEQFLGDIVFEIIARIKESRFIVADVTEHKNGVYFEGGYAMGMQLPVVWMCHTSDLAQAHFDTSHLNHIEWEQPSGLRKKLAERILATIGGGPRRKS